MLKNFKIDKNRDLLVPGIACYQMDMKRIVEDAINNMEIEDENFKSLPSWAATAANPLKNKSLLVRIINALFLGIGGYDELNVDHQAEIYKRTGPRVAMMFLPANTRNELLEVIGRIIEETLPAFEVVVLCGSIKHNGKKVTNRTAQEVVQEIVDRGRPVIIVAAQMAQRSFSIPQITELYLAYDRGDNGATTQKMSRVLTPGDKNKIGRIFSLSFDSNRDDKFDAMIVSTAINHKKRSQKKSLQDCLREVIRVIDIFKCQPDGAVRVSKADYLKEAFARNGISRVLGKIVNFELLSVEAISAIANGNNNYFRSQKQDAAIMGKTKETAKNKKIGQNSCSATNSEKEIARAREVITTIIENLNIIIQGTGKRVLSEAMAEIEKDNSLTIAVEEEFQLSFDIIKYLFENDIIKQSYVELMFDDESEK